MDRDGLADFLRHRRQALQPVDVGLGPSRHRRTPGLRREEVAALAHMSTDFYTRLEQRRGSRPSAQTIGAIARALRLTLDERDHLLQLAGHTAPPRTRRTNHVSPALLRVLDSVDSPAQIVSDLGVTLEQNPLADALLGTQTTHEGLERSMIYRWFTDTEARTRFPVEDHETQSRRYTGLLRAVQGRDPSDPDPGELIEALLQHSPEFAALWSEHEVGLPAEMRKRIAHPTIGLMELNCLILTAENQTEKLVVFTATPGTEDAERLALLRVIGNPRGGRRHRRQLTTRWSGHIGATNLPSPLEGFKEHHQVAVTAYRCCMRCLSSAHQIETVVVPATSFSTLSSYGRAGSNVHDVAAESAACRGPTASTTIARDGLRGSRLISRTSNV
jgi:transcriptional regulator with XRE-family HTH domain